MIKNLSYFGLIPCLLLLTGFPCQAQRTMAQKRLGSRAFHRIQRIDHVEAFRIANPFSPKVLHLKKIEGYPVTPEGSPFGAAFAHQLSGILLNDQTYQGRMAACFGPVVIFRAWSGKQYTDVLVCFHCHQVLIQSPEDKPFLGVYASTEILSRPNFLDLCHQAFPKDKELQAIHSVHFL